MDSEKELKPCPFCGGRAEVVPDKKGFGGFVGCMSLVGCLMPYTRYDKRIGPNATIKAWNTRATDNKGDTSD